MELAAPGERTRLPFPLPGAARFQALAPPGVRPALCSPRGRREGPVSSPPAENGARHSQHPPRSARGEGGSGRHPAAPPPPHNQRLRFTRHPESTRARRGRCRHTRLLGIPLSHDKSKRTGEKTNVSSLLFENNLTPITPQQCGSLTAARYVYRGCSPQGQTARSPQRDGSHSPGKATNRHHPPLSPSLQTCSSNLERFFSFPSAPGGGCRAPPPLCLAPAVIREQAAGAATDPSRHFVRKKARRS